ncbi:hypothetical protein F4559_000315 [Saccharothrix violaceirubra]|uniref:Uncharacterized protein n=1 Tax=Saccharothrix violaceirubra TaxID=413306 RepID=A0A7W7WT84_9PSEU|nr:hypothetical protein [Saccharothrix violaceirubra]
MPSGVGTIDTRPRPGRRVDHRVGWTGCRAEAAAAPHPHRAAPTTPTRHHTHDARPTRLRTGNAGPTRHSPTRHRTYPAPDPDAPDPARLTSATPHGILTQRAEPGGTAPGARAGSPSACSGPVEVAGGGAAGRCGPGGLPVVDRLDARMGRGFRSTWPSRRSTWSGRHGRGVSTGGGGRRCRGPGDDLVRDRSGGWGVVGSWAREGFVGPVPEIQRGGACAVCVSGGGARRCVFVVSPGCVITEFAWNRRSGVRVAAGATSGPWRAAPPRVVPGGLDHLVPQRIPSRRATTPRHGRRAWSPALRPFTSGHGRLRGDHPSNELTRFSRAPP